MLQVATLSKALAFFSIVPVRTLYERIFSSRGRILLRSEVGGPKLPTVGNSSSDPKNRILLTKFQQSPKLSTSDLAKKSEFEARDRTWGPGPKLACQRGGDPLRYLAQHYCTAAAPTSYAGSIQPLPPGALGRGAPYRAQGAWRKFPKKQTFFFCCWLRSWL